MNATIATLEARLRSEAGELEELEAEGRNDRCYRRLLRRWLELLAAYEYEIDLADAGSTLAAVV